MPQLGTAASRWERSILVEARASERLTRTINPESTPDPAPRKGAHAMQHSPTEPTSEPATPDVEQPDAKVVRLTPRRQPEPAEVPNPPATDDDPGPSAA